MPLREDGTCGEGCSVTICPLLIRYSGKVERDAPPENTLYTGSIVRLRRGYRSIGQNTPSIDTMFLGAMLPSATGDDHASLLSSASSRGREVSPFVRSPEPGQRDKNKQDQ